MGNLVAVFSLCIRAKSVLKLKNLIESQIHKNMNNSKTINGDQNTEILTTFTDLIDG